MQPIATQDGQFRDGDPYNGTQGTQVTAAWLNAIQGELLSVIAAAGLAPAANLQLLQALMALMATATTQAPGDASTKVATTAFVQTAINGIAAINIAGNADKVLSQAQWGNGILIFNGALTGNINIIVPAQGDRWIVFNRASGAFTVTVKTQNGAGVIVRPGTCYELICDGTDVSSISGGGSGGKAIRWFLSTT
jgi:hypothetical protein